MGPGGNIDVTNGRVSVGSVTDNGNNMYTRSLQLNYLMEGDEGTYTCYVMILGTSVSQSVEVQSLTGKHYVSCKLEIKFNMHKILNSCILFFTYSLNGRHYTLQLKLLVTNNSNFKVQVFIVAIEHTKLLSRAS